MKYIASKTLGADVVTAIRTPSAMTHRLATSIRRCFAFVLFLGLGPGFASSTGPAHSPVSLVGIPQVDRVAVALQEPPQVRLIDRASRQVTRSIALPARPTGLALDPNGRWLWVTLGAPVHQLAQLDVRSGAILQTLSTGYEPASPTVSPSGLTVFVCCPFLDSVSAWKTGDGQALWRLKLRRQPVELAVSPDGSRLVVANHQPAGRSDDATTAAIVAVVDARSGDLDYEVPLPPGSTQVRGVAVSPDGRWACVTHLVARFGLPTTHVDRGWMNSNAITFIPLHGKGEPKTVLLDEVHRGAANPWAVVWSSNGERLFVSHAGTHEVSVIAIGSLLERITDCADTENDLTLLLGLRSRVALTGQGARSMALLGSHLWVAQVFTDDLSLIDLADATHTVERIPLGASKVEPEVRRGERLFNDATLCFQGWQSCASCHGHDARSDGLNWDLLNDGTGNPKNTKSLVWSHRTPPVMSLGVRDRAETAVRAGLRYILFAVRPRDEARAIDAWLRSLEPLPSPWLEGGLLGQSARRGERLFFDDQVGCVTCHVPGLFTDQLAYDVGTAGALDRRDEAYDTPTLTELWRTGPYLHDGSAVTLRQVLTERNPADLHGTTSHLSQDEITDLETYLLSL